MKEQKTAEQIIREKIKEYSASTVNIDVDNIPAFTHFLFVAIEAIQEYSDQQNAELLAWKESAMRELNELDLQSLGKKLGIGLGQSVSENVHAKVDGLLERVKELEAALSKVATITVDDIAYIIAKEALKQEVNND